MTRITGGIKLVRSEVTHKIEPPEWLLEAVREDGLTVIFEAENLVSEKNGDLPLNNIISTEE